MSSENRWEISWNTQIKNKKTPLGVTVKPAMYKKLTSTNSLMNFSFSALHYRKHSHTTYSF